MKRLLTVLFFVAGCGSPAAPMSTYSITFKPTVGSMPFACGSTYTGIGTTKTTIQPLDFRMYVHDVQLIRATGDMVPLTLNQDNTWQAGNIAFLDFEDGTGLCNTASPETNYTVTGTAPPQSDYMAVQFTLGVPADHDHLNSAVASAPLNIPAMWWSWTGGYRYFRIDVQSTMNPMWSFHLGAMYCQGASATSISCKYDDLSLVKLTSFSGNAATIGLDVANLFSTSDLDHQVDGMTDFVAGCMSGDDDPECPPLFGKVGLTFQSSDPGPAQTLFVGQ